MLSRWITRKPLSHCVGGSVLFVLLSLSGGCPAQERPPASAKSGAVPTFEILPHIPLPRGQFVAWCGRNDRYLFAPEYSYVDAYDGNTKISAPSPTGSRSVQCGPDGRHILFSEEEYGRVRRFELATGKSEILATFPIEQGSSLHLSFSPDLKSAVTNVPLQLTAEAAGLQLVTVTGPVGKIGWSDDGAKVFLTRPDAVDVLDRQGKRIGGGALPKHTSVREGWFDPDRQAVFLFLVREIDEAIGPLIKCRIVDWQCVRLKERVEQASGGGRGLVATVGPLDRPKPPDDDSTVLYSRYAAELRDRAFRLLFRQEFRWAAGRTDVRLFVSPSANKAVLSWALSERANCANRDATDENCQRGWILDLTKVAK